MLHWITSAKRPETRAKRLATLIEDSAAGRKIAGYDIGRKKMITVTAPIWLWSEGQGAGIS